MQSVRTKMAAILALAFGAWPFTACNSSLSTQIKHGEEAPGAVLNPSDTGAERDSAPGDTSSTHTFAAGASERWTAGGSLAGLAVDIPAAALAAATTLQANLLASGSQDAVLEIKAISPASSVLFQEPVTLQLPDALTAPFAGMSLGQITVTFTPPGGTPEIIASGSVSQTPDGHIVLTLSSPLGQYAVTEASPSGPAATVASVTATDPSGTYGAGKVLTVQVGFSSPVTVVGTPKIMLATVPPRAATYASGSGTNTLSFTYTVQSGDTAAALDYQSASSLSLSGGSLKDAAGKSAAISLPAPGSPQSLSGTKTLVVDGVAPVVTAVTSTSPSATYAAGSVIAVQVKLSKPVTVTGVPQLTLGTTPNHTVDYTSGSGSDTLVFNYTVQAGDTATALDYKNAAALALNGGSVRDTAGNDATLTLAPPGSPGSLSAAQSIVIAAAGPHVTNVTSNKTSATYPGGTLIDVRLTFSANVTVTGTPQLTLGTTPVNRVVNYATGSGSNTLVFNYTVQAGDTAATLDYKDAAALALNGGTIKDASNNAASLILPAPSDPGSLSANKTIVVDAKPPTVIDVSSSTADGSFTVGSVISVTVQFSEVVVVNPSYKPSLTLHLTPTNRTVVYTSGSGSDTLTFAYTVQASDTSTALNYTSTTALTQSGIVPIKDQAGNNAVVTLPNPSDPHSLAANKSLVVDTANPSTPATLSATTGDAQLTLNWTGGGGESGYLLVRRAGAAVTWTPTRGSAYTTGDSLDANDTAAYVGPNLTAVDTLLSNGATYNYALFAYDAALNYSAAKTTTGRPRPTLNPSFTQLVNGAGHSCGLTSGGIAWCWGDNTLGQLAAVSGAAGSALLPVRIPTTAMTGQTAFKQLAAGSNHTCGLTNEGLAWCWGAGGAGQLGNNATADAAVPVAVSVGGMTGETSFIELAAHANHTCGLTTQGLVWCWGKNDHGQLGNGTTTSSPVPVPLTVSGMTGQKAFIHLAAGGNHTCGLTGEGLIWCWGADNAGQLGDNSVTDASTPVALQITGVTGEQAFKAVTAGDNHTCALTAEGLVWCWGAGSSGQLGNSATADAHTPVAVATGAMTGQTAFKAIVSGANHTCALTAQGVSWCWGDGTSGQLGNNATAAASAPVALATSGMTGSVLLRSLSAGAASTCGLTSGGIAWCWGANSFGQLGDNGTSDAPVPAAVVTTNMTRQKVFMDVYQGDQNSCGLTSEGVVFCWGNMFTHAPSYLDTSSMGAESNFVKLSVGYNHTCGLTAAGVLWCWGFNSFDQLGTGAPASTALPRAIDISGMTGQTAFVDVGAGQYHTCALTAQGRIWCWGNGQNGELGINSPPASSPALVAVDTTSVTGQKAFRDISSGYFHTCAVSSQGVPYCWGSNTNYQIGNGGSLARTPQPVTMTSVTGQKALRGISGGYQHTCGLTAAGIPWCWGSSGGGVLGNNSSAGLYSTPVAVITSGMTGELSMQRINAGESYTCGLTGTGLMWCWGGNGMGQLGRTPIGGNILVPAAVMTGSITGQTAFRQINATGYTVTAVTGDGNTWAWGYNYYYQLGDGTQNDSGTPLLIDTSDL